MSRLNYLAWLAPIALVAYAVPASAQVTVYTDRTAFIAALATYNNDTYEDLPAGLPSGSTRANGAFPYQVASTAGGLARVGPAGDRWLSTGGEGTMTFSSFGSNVNAVGGYLFMSDLNGTSAAPAPITITAVTSTGSSTQTYSNTATTNFVGFITTGTFTSLQLSDTTLAPNQFVTADDFIVGSTVPEPGSWAMMILGFGLVGYTLRRQRGRRLAAA